MGQNKRSPSDATVALAAAIREAQGRANVSGAEFARRSGIPYSSLRKIREGKMTVDYEQLRKIARSLNVSVATITDRAEEIEAEAQK